MAAIYQWFHDEAALPPEVTDDFLNYEFVLMATDQDWLCRYIGLNYDTGITTDFGQFYTDGNCSVVSDGKNVIADIDGVGNNPHQLVWRGHTFSDVLSDSHGGINVSSGMISATVPYAIVNGIEAFGHSCRLIDYAQSAPYNISDVEIITFGPHSERWDGFFDINYGLAGERGYGDAFVSIPYPGNDMSVFTVNGLELVEEMRLVGVSEYPATGSIAEWGHDTNSGYLAHCNGLSGIGAQIWFYDVDPVTLIPTYYGTDNANGFVLAVGFAPHGTHVVTLENGGAFAHRLRCYTYNHSGGNPVITLTDTLDIEGVTSTNCHFQVSRVSGRIWMTGTIGAGGPGGVGTKVFHIDGSDNIVEDIDLTYSTGSSGYLGNPLSFLESPLTITSNGFSGIKGKLFEAWELNETSGHRIGSMNNQHLYLHTGSVGARSGRIGLAADFPGTGALSTTLIEQEVRTVDNFSNVMDLIVDVKGASDQYIIQRGRQDYTAASPSQKDWGLRWDAGLDRFVFFVRTGGTEYTVAADNEGAITAGVAYHIYYEYNKTADTISIRVNNGTVDTTALPPGMTLNAFFGATQSITLGRESSASGGSGWWDGAIDCLFWFYDVLTPAEQSWMYNGGFSRAFAEL